MMKNRMLSACAVVLMSIGLAGCPSDADVASYNVSKAADNFEVQRRVIFYNGITGEYMLSIEGLCSLGNNDKAREVSVTCKTAPNMFKKHFLGLSDNVTFFAEQIDGVPASIYRYRVIFKPTVIIPAVELR